MDSREPGTISTRTNRCPGKGQWAISIQEGSKRHSNMPATIPNATGTNPGLSQKAISVKEGLAGIPKAKFPVQVCCGPWMGFLLCILCHRHLLCWRGLERVSSQGSQHQGVKKANGIHGPSNRYPLVNISWLWIVVKPKNNCLNSISALNQLLSHLFWENTELVWLTFSMR